MQTPYRATALALMMDLLPALERVIDRVHRHDKHLADQLKRAATSVVLNHAEADGSDAGNRRARIHTALGSLRETRTALLVAAAWEYVPRDEVERLDADLDRVAAMTSKRLRG
jgi:four helix bundle protein